MKSIKLITVLALALLSGNLYAGIAEKEVDYSVNGVSFKGFIAYDDAQQGKRPGVLVVHEWWGHNEYARKRTRMLAKMGYVAMALDMYGGGQQADHPKDAGKFSSAIVSNLPEAEKRFMAAYKTLQNQPQTDGKQIAAIGYCFGGGISLAMARRGVNLKAVASFHGNPGIGGPVKKGVIKARVLVLNGKDDPFIKPEVIKAFKKEMKQAGVKYKFINYPGAKHAFTNPDADKFGKKFSIPLAYNKKADQASWSEMTSFLKTAFK